MRRTTSRSGSTNIRRRSKKLLDVGAAYRDFRHDRRAAGRARGGQKPKSGPFVYSRRWRAETDADAKRFEAEGRQGVVRLLMPREGQFVLNDLVRGEVRVDWASEQDHVIQRADGTCLYHLATVVDDHDMQISHVIRAEEHLSNTPRQVFMFERLGYALPQFAHLPYVAEPGSKTKLSKRKLDKYLKNRDFAALMEHGQSIARRMGLAVAADTFNPVIVDFYEQVGYLPDALFNYLLLLGWSLDDKTEEFTRDEMLRHFSLERVNKAPASFDPEKLLAFETRAMQQLPIKQQVAKSCRSCSGPACRRSAAVRHGPVRHADPRSGRRPRESRRRHPRLRRLLRRRRAACI